VTTGVRFGPMGSRIRFRDAQGREGLIELANDPVYVGRAPDCAIRSDDAMVSRRHSRIKREGSAFFIEDLDSSNGTMVNNSRVQKHQLRNDDAVICGSLTLLYMEDAFQQPPPTMMAPAMRPQMPPPPAAASIPAMPSMTDIEIQRLKDSIESLRLEVDEARAAKEKEVAEGMRLRAEHLRFHQRLEDQQQMIHDSTEAVEEHKRIIEDMKPEVEKAHAERDKAAMEAAEAREQVASANRQLQRVQEEATKVKADLERHKKMITELTAAKEDGYKKLNEQLAEVDQVRQVVREQERMLEDRRVGLINLEESLKELRAKSDQRTRETAQAKAERDELAKENQRLTRLLQDKG